MWDGRPARRSHAGRSPILLMLICALVALTAGVGAGLLIGRRALAGSKQKGGQAAPNAHAEGFVEPASIISLGELVVNLADTDALRYVKISASLGLAERESEEKMKEQAPLLRDSVIEAVSSKLFRDLHKPSGVAKLKGEIRTLTQKRLPHTTVLDVYFDSFAMQ
jgi:flagellar basal body-associated protein FliL